MRQIRGRADAEAVMDAAAFAAYADSQMLPSAIYAVRMEIDALRVERS